MILGRHVEFSQSDLTRSFKAASKLAVNSIAIFTKPPQQWTGRKFSDVELKAWHDAWARQPELAIYAHAGYFPNIASGEKRSQFAVLHEARRCAQLGIQLLVLHPGSSLKQTKAEGIGNAVSLLRGLIAYWPKNVTLLLENMSGQGNVLSELHTLQQIITGIPEIPMGICYDTAHAHAYGTDLLTTEEIYDPAIKLFHINGCQTAFASKKDRHANLGTGTLPLAAIQRVAQVKGVPFIMETPPEGAMRDLEIFRDLAK